MLPLTLFLYLVTAYLGFYVAYYLFFSVAGCFYAREPVETYRAPYSRFAVIIPAYAEDEVIVGTVQRCLAHNYPAGSFHVIIAWDALQPATAAQLAGLPITSLRVEGTKGQALQGALHRLDSDYDHVLVLDADNTLKDDCLLKMNESFRQGAQVVQAHRKSKNRKNPIEMLDSVSEEINNHIFRKGHRRIGLSAALIGSGMGFDYDCFREIIGGIEGIWEDREMELHILSRNITIEYLDDAVVYDEKVGRPNVFVKQRAKWIGGQLRYIRRTFGFWRAGMNAELLAKLVQSACPPRALLLGVLMLLLLVQSAFRSHYAFVWLGLFLFYCLALIMAVPAELRNRHLLKALARLPLLVALMFWALALSIVRRKEHYHTPHVYK